MADTSPPRFLTRLSLHYSSCAAASQFFRDFGDKIQTFDIVAVHVSSSKALNHASELNNIDLISPNISKPTDFRISSKHLSLFLSHGVRIEINYSPLLQVGNPGQVAISGLASVFGHLFSISRRHISNCLVFSSGAVHPWEIRRPLSMLSVFSCLGLQLHRTAFLAFTNNPFAAVAHGLSRSQTALGVSTYLRLLNDPTVIDIIPLRRAIDLASDQGPDEKRTKWEVEIA
ncbi:unnamed protein product [Protopolystoma xenopodis]|uniref:RNase P subunit p30 n=1 Tax=Protopolystoma xenopodis TaxID=117903 RepID=A0A3S4ZV51_9PLAT|nr:unnamed protein product [Protopolystoma xenopodis]